MDLAKRIAALIEREDGRRPSHQKRLRGTPPAVVEDVVRQTLRQLGEICAAGQTVDDLFADDVAMCGACDGVTRTGRPENYPGVTVDEDGVVLCGSCVEETTREAAGAA